MKLTFKQVVEKIGANSSTLAFQRDKFAEFIPCENEGRHRRYNQESVDVLTITSSMYAAGKSYEEIKDALESRYGVPTDIIVKDNNSPTTQQVEFMDAIREVFQQELSKRDNLILNLQQELADIKEALATIHQTSESRAINSENRDRDIMQTIRVLQDEKGKQKQSLWRKIFKT